MTRSRFLPSTLGLAAASLSVLTGCPGETPAADAARELDAAMLADANGTEDASVSDDAVSPEDAPAVEDAFSADDAASAVDAPVAPDAAVTGDVTLTLADVVIYGNCFPVAPEQPTTFWTVRATGPAETVVTVESAALRIRSSSGTVDETQTLSIDMASFTIPALGATEQMMRKTAGDPDIAVCSLCSETLSGELTLQVSAGGTGHVLTATSDVGCVF